MLSNSPTGGSESVVPDARARSLLKADIEKAESTARLCIRDVLRKTDARLTDVCRAKIGEFMDTQMKTERQKQFAQDAREQIPEVPKQCKKTKVGMQAMPFLSVPKRPLRGRAPPLDLGCQSRLESEGARHHQRGIEKTTLQGKMRLSWWKLENWKRICCVQQRCDGYCRRPGQGCV